MTVIHEFKSFDELTVARPAFIRHPKLRQLAERVQQRTLKTLPDTSSDTLVSASAYNLYDKTYNERVLQSLYQTPIADASVLVAITRERRPKLLLTAAQRT